MSNKFYVDSADDDDDFDENQTVLSSDANALYADEVTLGSDTQSVSTPVHKRVKKTPVPSKQATKFTVTFQLRDTLVWTRLAEDAKAWFDDSMVTYIVIGHETAPTTGKKHGQGYLELPPHAKITVKGLTNKLAPWKPHIEVAVAGPDQNRKYCLGLSEGKTPNPVYVELGKPRSYTKDGPGARQKMDWAAQYTQAKTDFTLCDPRLVITCFNNLQKINHSATGKDVLSLGHKNWWLYGKPGTGKSRTARAMATALGCPTPYLKDSLTKWWDNYSNEAVVLVDELELDAKHMGHLLKMAGDVYAFKAEIKGSSKQIRPDHIIVTSNYTIEEVWLDVQMREAMHRRYKVLHVLNFEQALNEWQSATHATQAVPLTYTTPMVPGFTLSPASFDLPTQLLQTQQEAEL